MIGIWYSVVVFEDGGPLLSRVLLLSGCAWILDREDRRATKHDDMWPTVALDLSMLKVPHAMFPLTLSKGGEWILCPNYLWILSGNTQSKITLPLKHSLG